jgi:hypothetical protein
MIILLHHSECFARSTSSRGFLHHWRFIDAVTQLVECGLMRPGAPEDDAALRRFLVWINTWTPDEKMLIQPLLPRVKALLPTWLLDDLEFSASQTLT